MRVLHFQTKAANPLANKLPKTHFPGDTGKGGRSHPITYSYEVCGIGGAGQIYAGKEKKRRNFRMKLVQTLGPAAKQVADATSIRKPALVLLEVP